MTASPPKVNGQARPPAPPVLGDWQPVEATPTQADTPTPAKTEPAEPQADSGLVAQAKAEAIRAQAWADAEAKRIAAEAEAEAVRIKADGEAKAAEILAVEQAEALRLENEKQALTLQRNQLRFRREEAVEEAKIAKAEAEKEETDRAREAARRTADEQKQAERKLSNEVAQADRRWRKYALSFYTVCAIVALPVQVAAFYNPRALWLMAAPLMLEGGAWVVLKGAAAAVASHRPHWHYRLIAWLLAFIAAGINLWHGLNAFDPATAIGTAFASIAGPGVWDLHEHGRIRKRDGKLSWRERRAQAKAAKDEAARRAAEEKRRAAEKEAADQAAAEEAKQLTERRRRLFTKVWEHAEKLATDLGEVDPNAVWERAKLDVEGAKPGESAEVLRMRNAAAARVEAARQNKPVNTLSKSTNAQRAAQMPPGPNRVLKTRATRRPGDTPKYAGVARKQAAITARQAAQNTSPNAN